MLQGATCCSVLLLQGATCCSVLLLQGATCCSVLLQGGPPRASVLLQGAACCTVLLESPQLPEEEGAASAATDGKAGKGEFQRCSELARNAAFWLLALRGAQRKERKRAVFRSFLVFLSLLTDSGGPSLHFLRSEQLCCSRFHFWTFWPLNRLLSQKS